jgi:hypothetical protein
MCSMGVYVFNAKYLYAELARDINDPTSSHDFGKDIIPRAVANGVAYAHIRSRAVASLPRTSSSGSTTGATPGRSMPTGTPTST